MAAAAGRYRANCDKFIDDGSTGFAEQGRDTAKQAAGKVISETSIESLSDQITNDVDEVQIDDRFCKICGGAELEGFCAVLLVSS